MGPAQILVPIHCWSDLPLGGFFTLFCQEGGQEQPVWHNPGHSHTGLAPRYHGNGLFTPHLLWQQGAAARLTRVPQCLSSQG